jgi:hypothetical protein
MTEPDATTLPPDVAATIRAFVMDSAQTAGHLTVEIATEGRPIEASGYAELITDTVKLLWSIEKSLAEQSPEPRTPVKWAIIEAAIVGDRACFTLKAYPKSAFRIPRKTELKSLAAAARDLIEDVRRRHPGEELHCPKMRSLEAAVLAMEEK